MRKMILILCVLTMAVGLEGVAESSAPTNKVIATSSRWQLEDNDLAKTDLAAAIKDFARKVDGGESWLYRDGFKILAAIRQIQDAKEKRARLDEFRKILLSAKMGGGNYTVLYSRLRAILELCDVSDRVWGDDVDNVKKEIAFRLEYLDWLRSECDRQAAVTDNIVERDGLGIFVNKGMYSANLEVEYRYHVAILERLFNNLCEEKKFASEIDELRKMIETWLVRPIRKCEEL